MREVHSYTVLSGDHGRQKPFLDLKSPVALQCLTTQEQALAPLRGVVAIDETQRTFAASPA